MKPSFGMIPRTGVLKTTDSLDSIGFVACHAKSLRPLLDFTRVRGPDYPFVYRHVDSAGTQPKPEEEPWRVGFVRTHTWHGAANYARDAVVSLAERISQEPDFNVEEIAWPDLLHAAHEVHSLIYAKSLSYYFQSEAKLSSYISPIMSEMIAAGQEISTSQFQDALRKQEDIAQAVDELFTGYDFVISLGTSSIAPERGVEEIPDPSLIWTLSQLPSVAIPAFRGPGDLPFGAQFVSRRWNDYRLLQGIEQLADRGVLPAGSQPVLRWQ